MNNVIFKNPLVNKLCVDSVPVVVNVVGILLTFLVSCFENVIIMFPRSRIP